MSTPDKYIVSGGAKLYYDTWTPAFREGVAFLDREVARATHDPRPWFVRKFSRDRRHMPGMIEVVMTADGDSTLGVARFLNGHTSEYGPLVLTHRIGNRLSWTVVGEEEDQ